MAFKVIATVSSWRNFLRKAKASFPIEYCEAIWGEETLTSYRIIFKKLRTTKANSHAIYYDDSELKRQKWLAKKSGKIFLGTVHTHPHQDSDSAPSAIDHHVSAKDGEQLIGIVVLYKKDGRFNHEVNWWFPQDKIDFILIEDKNGKGRN